MHHSCARRAAACKIFFLARHVCIFFSRLLQRPHRRQAAICVSSYCCICVLILLHKLIYVCPHIAAYVSSYCYICVLILRYVSSYCYICVLILPSSYCYIRVLILRRVSKYCSMCPHTAMCALYDLVHST